ncbi:MAG TPA: glycosyltransferase family 2 protein [Stellaceae bacterium]|nr:glycosyltransferase family 2 protein [Stellaceae bacterium]
MTLPSITYLVTIYNKAPYIEGVLAAVRDQRGAFARQVVLVDDGSTDGSAEIASRVIADWPEALLIRQPNCGPSVAVNRGLAVARMKFTQIVDGDDILAPYASQLLAEAALASGCGAVYARNTWYGSPEEIRFPPEPQGVEVAVMADPLYDVIRIGHAGGSTYILDTALFRRVGGCDERVFVQDQSIPQRMAFVTRIGLVDHIVCMGPRDEPGRLMKDPVQQTHDQSLTALCTLRDHAGLPRRIRRLVQKQVTGRAWKWATRHNGATVLSREFWLFLAARLPGVRFSDETLAGTLEAFRRRHPIRLMPAPSEVGLG